jgi:Raf kinase inhibitor-like YbhB/YbcL family protein
VMTLSSSSFEDGGDIPQKHGKKIENVSPALSWSDAPRGTRSFALCVVDRSPVARNYLHWLVLDIPSDVSSLKEGAAGGAMPEGSRESKPYAGPFPPSGTHDYEFSLLALDIDRLEMPKEASLEAFTRAADPHALETARLVGRFTRH